MEQQHDDRPESGLMSVPRAFKDQLLGPPRPDTRAQVFVALFGLLTVLSLAVPTLAESRAMPLIFGGITATGFADLLDRKLHRFVVSLRLVGPVIALSGLAIQFL